MLFCECNEYEPGKEDELFEFGFVIEQLTFGYPSLTAV